MVETLQGGIADPLQLNDTLFLPVQISVYSVWSVGNFRISDQLVWISG